MRILVTAFEPYDHWKTNSSWLVLMEMLKSRSPDPRITTRRYPVDFELVNQRLRSDLEKGYEAVVHLGQAPGATSIRLESVAINVAGNTELKGTDFPTLIPSGPVAYRSASPLANWRDKLQENGVPADISHHAGTYLCNAIMYLSHYYLSQADVRPRVSFLHLPLTVEQVIQEDRSLPSLSTALMARGVSIVLDELLRSFEQNAEYA